MARDKARFLGMLSHELLTPLQSIWSTMDVIESRGRVDAADPAFTRLKEATRSLRGRISDLVDFAKMSSGRLETRIRGFQLDKLIDTALRDVEEALAARNLDVHWEAGPELGQRIYSDPARLRQVIDNLLTNAIKYTERGGISIAAALRRDAACCASRSPTPAWASTPTRWRACSSRSTARRRPPAWPRAAAWGWRWCAAWST